MVVDEKAPSKINLGLRILGKRENGYHTIQSIFQTVGLYDDLRLSPSNETGLSCTDPGIPTGTDNLVLKADELFKKHTGLKKNVHFHLKKRIPVGAGLAGGSSDAAAALRGLRRFSGGEISDAVLRDYASELGSDIPFLINGGTAVVGGRGEVISEVEWQFDFTYVLVYPGFSVSTRWAYRNLEKLNDEKDLYNEMIVKLKAGKPDAELFFRALRNDFETVVFHRYPKLEKIKSDLLKHGSRASVMTGSGSCILGVFEDEFNALECARIFESKSKKYRVFTVKKYP